MAAVLVRGEASQGEMLVELVNAPGATRRVRPCEQVSALARTVSVCCGTGELLVELVNAPGAKWQVRKRQQVLTWSWDILAEFVAVHDAVSDMKALIPTSEKVAQPSPMRCWHHFD